MHIYQVARRLRNYSVTVFSVADPKLSRTEQDGHLRYVRIDTTPYHNSVVDWLLSLGSTRIGRVLDYYRYLRFVIDDLNKTRPAIIHVHNTYYFVSDLRRHLNYAPVILLHMNNSHLVNRKYKFGLQAVQASNLVIGCSEFIVNEIESRFPQAQGRTALLHNGTDLKDFDPSMRHSQPSKSIREKLGISPDGPVLGFAGRLVPEKGVDVLLRAAEIVAARLKSTLTILICGGPWPPTGTNGHLTQLKDLAKRAEAAGVNVCFTGFVTPSDMPSYFSLMDIFVAPALWDEPFATVYIEAGAMGLPVITSARGGIPELIVPGESGLLLAEPSDPNCLANAIIALLQNPSLAHQYGMKLRSQVENGLTWDHIAQATDECYDAIIN